MDVTNTNDHPDDVYKKRREQFLKLRSIVLPEQRSPEWFAMRNERATASDGGCILGKNKYEAPYKFILKKTVGKKFESNKFCYHGTKYEEIATMIYQYRYDTIVEEFGLMAHPTIPFLGASPDGICNGFKLDGKTKSNLVGRMLEIKCPLSRKIITTGNIKDNICPIYYWIQVQLQLQCCELDDCDFWQCSISEYDDRKSFIEDTNQKDAFRSSQTGFEKGCLIQLLPTDKFLNAYKKYGNYDQISYDHSKFIHPPKIEMSPSDCDSWIAEMIDKIQVDPLYKGYTFDKVKYWRLEKAHNVTIKRDDKWFEEALPKFKKMWDYVLFLRRKKKKLKILVDYIEIQDTKYNKDIMSVIEKLYNTKDKDYKSYVKKLKKTIKKTKKMTSELDDYLF